MKRQAFAARRGNTGAVFLGLAVSLFALFAPRADAATVALVDICATNRRASVGVEYVRALERAGHVPVVLPRIADRALVAEQVRRVDLVLFCGGQDIAPFRYGEQTSPRCEAINEPRDVYEWMVLDECVKLRRPVFGICRGEQLINCYFGGTLYQDIPTEVAGCGRHRFRPGEPRGFVDHDIRVLPGSRLAATLGMTDLSAKTWHHQAVGKLAPGFRVAARTADGVVEAIESDRYPAAGVQFHPEMNVADDPESPLLRIFRDLPRLCGSVRAVRVTGLDASATPKANAAVLQAAIDGASAKGGGTVSVPPGTWTCGTIWMKSGVELHLEEGAVLRASADLDDYNAPDAFEQNFSVTNEQWTGRHFIIFHEVANAGITGRGTVDGNGGAFYEAKAPPRRPGIPVWRDGIRMAKDKSRLRAGPMIFCVECRDLRFEDFLAKDSPCWCLTLLGCERVLVRGYRVRCGPTDGNSDGLDICTSTDVTVRDCDIVTGDDAVAVTASPDHLRHREESVCERIRISNCRFSTSAMGIRFGVGRGLVRDVAVTDVTIDHAAWAVSFETYYGSMKDRGVDMEDLSFTRLEARDCYGNWRIRAGGDRIVNGVRRLAFRDCRFGGLVCGDLLGDATTPVDGVRFDNCVYSPFPNNTFRHMLKDAPPR